MLLVRADNLMKNLADKVRSMRRYQKSETDLLRASGEHILSALRSKRCLTPEELSVLPDIVDYTESKGMKILATYALTVAAITLLGLTVDGIWEWKLKDTLPPVFLVLFVGFIVHVNWSLTGGRDCRIFQISQLLRCGSCGRKISGSLIHRMVETSQCPHCSASLSDVFGQIKVVCVKKLGEIRNGGRECRDKPV